MGYKTSFTPRMYFQENPPEENNFKDAIVQIDMNLILMNI
jgi:hypothetical protein